MKKIYLLTDYKGFFGSKYNAAPYRSGMDKNLLHKYFRQENVETKFIQGSDIDFREMDFKNQIVLYTSSEDIGYDYKDFLEDIVLGLELQGALVVPSFKYLRAHNNKVFMEILRDQSVLGAAKTLKASYFGTFEEANQRVSKLKTPIVVKSAMGAMSRGVHLARDRVELLKKVKKISRTPHVIKDLKDRLRPYKHRKYIKESLYRRKFLLQDFIPQLKSDYKILIFGSSFFIFERPVRNNDFRASGSGAKNYIYGSQVKYPKGIFDFAAEIFENMALPHLSLDIVFDGTHFHLLEFQAVYFGTVGHVKSDIFFKKKKDIWESFENTLSIEQVYVNSIVWFLNKLS